MKVIHGSKQEMSPDTDHHVMKRSLPDKDGRRLVKLFLTIAAGGLILVTGIGGLAKLNDHHDTEINQTGLKMPSQPDAAINTAGMEADAAEQTVELPTDYTITEGDTLDAVSIRFYQSTKYSSLIAEYNDIYDMNQLKIGTELVIPVESDLLTLAEPAELPTTYKVRKGDTLEALSQKFYRSVQYVSIIAEANGLSNNNILKAGDQLVIPAKT